MHRTLPIALAALLLLGAAAASADTLVEKFEQTYAFEGRVFSLTNVNGSVNIRVWDRPEVRIAAEKRVRSGSREAAMDAMERLRIEVSRTGDGVAVRTHYPRRNEGIFELFDFFSGSEIHASVLYDVTVPRTAMVAVDVVNAGVEIIGARGGFDLETVNGKIDVIAGAGAFEASAVNGSISAELEEVGEIEVSTVNGRIRLELPQDIRADVAISTVNGRISNELPLITHQASRQKLRGAINGGGEVRIDLSTVNGSVTLASH